jgi:hypothetical protein
MMNAVSLDGLDFTLDDRLRCRYRFENSHTADYYDAVSLY